MYVVEFELGSQNTFYFNIYYSEASSPIKWALSAPVNYSPQARQQIFPSLRREAHLVGGKTLIICESKSHLWNIFQGLIIPFTIKLTGEKIAT